MFTFQRIANNLRLHVCLPLAFCILSSVTYAADRVAPSDKVNGPLIVRQLPTVDSNVIGSLSIHESAELVNSVPSWYEIKLDNGNSGYVSKRWSKVISTAKGTGELFRIGSWNIKKLGHGTSKNYALLAQTIENNFDVLAVVEVMQEDQAHGGYDSLLSALGENWKGLITDSPRPNTAAGHSEFYAILYRPSLVRPCNGWHALIYHDDNDGSGNDTGADNFSREPAYGCFEVPANNSTIGFDFILAAYHATFKDTSSIKAEVRHLSEVFGSMAAAKPGEKDLIIAGDFNLKPNELSAETGMQVVTVGTGSTLNTSGNRTANQYDHMLIYNFTATSEKITNPTLLDILSITSDGKEFYDTISDHLPIVANFRTIGPDDD